MRNTEGAQMVGLAGIGTVFTAHVMIEAQVGDAASQPLRGVRRSAITKLKP